MSQSRNFALIGVAGYIAPRHLQAIKDTGNKLIAALDRSDSVGIIDKYFPDSDVSFFTEFERFDRYAEKLRRAGEDKRIHYVSICSPNYLHDAHIRFALRIGADAICEKPLVVNPWNLDALAELEKETGRHIYTVLQLRVHPAVLELRNRVMKDAGGGKHNVEMSYITPRGRWYSISWKGDPQKSGGIATNIGIHLFDLLLWIFGPGKHHVVHYSDQKKVGGYLELERANVKWFLSLDPGDLPDAMKCNGKSSYRSLKVDDKEIEFSDGFADLHTAVYEAVLAGRGFGIEDARPSISLAHAIRNSNPIGIKPDYCHPFLLKIKP